MSTADTTAALGARASRTGAPAVAHVVDWVTSSDHKRVGRLMIAGSLVAAVATACVGAILGFERVTTDSFELIQITSTPQWIAFFRYGLVFLVMAPLLLGVAVAVVPLQVGSRSIAFGRLAQFGLWTWLFGAILVVISVTSGGGPGGAKSDLVHLYLFGLMMSLAGLAAVAATVAATVLTARAPGMDLMRTPAFSWSALVASTAIVLTFPVALGTTVYLYVEHSHLGTTFGESVDLTAPLGWLFDAPLTSIFVVTVLGLAAEVAPVTFRVRQVFRGAMLTGIAVAGLGLLTGVTQTQQMLDLSGSLGKDAQSALLYGLFNVLPALGPLVVLGLIALDVRGGTVSINGPFAASVLGVVSVAIAGGANAVAHVTSQGLVGSVYNEAIRTLLTHGVVIASIGAVAWWFPKWTGRRIADGRVLVLSGLAFLGAVLASVPYLVAGYDGQPADALTGYNYDGLGWLWSTLVGCGHVVLVLAAVGFAVAALRASRSGESVGDDPWDGHTLEWSTSSPAPAVNFVEVAVVGSAEPLLDIKPATGGGR